VSPSERAMGMVAALVEFARPAVRECEGCLCTYGACGSCGAVDWLTRTHVGAGDDDTALLCARCGCGCCTDGAPRSFAHEHCPTHGSCHCDECSFHVTSEQHAVSCLGQPERA
jgi:hypothetical protein